MINILTKSSFSYSVVQDMPYGHVARLLNDVAPLYPGFDSWFNFTFWRNLSSGTRKLAIVHDGSLLIGAALLKQDGKESKICTFYIRPGYQGMGIGDELMRVALETLDDHRSFITVCSERYDELLPLLTSKGFKDRFSIPGLYREGSAEHFFHL